jgi:CheY-like chemotaxis protein
MSAIQNYILVDDDPVNNTICRMALRRTLGEVDIQIFTVPEDGLAFIKREYSTGVKSAILFLDINMPTLTGWEFVEHYEKFSEAVKIQIAIYILSSSIDQQDKDKANTNKHIRGFISKPLNPETILSLGIA